MAAVNSRIRILVLAATLGLGPVVPTDAAERPLQNLAGGGVPVTVSADQMAYANRDGKLIFSGHVQVVREGQIMSSDRLEVSLDAAQAGPAGEKSTPRRDVSRMVAEGNVVFEYGDRTARAGRAEYTPATATVVLTGTPKLSDPRMQVAGEVITIDLNTQESTVQGGSFTYTEPDQGTDTAPPAGGQ